MNDAITLPIGYIITVIGCLATTISILAGIIYSSLNKRLSAQDKIIESQTATIGKLQEDIERLQKGCGQEACHWKNR